MPKPPGPGHKGRGKQTQIYSEVDDGFIVQITPTQLRIHNIFLFHIPSNRWDRKSRNSPKPTPPMISAFFGFTEPPGFPKACTDLSTFSQFVLTDSKPAFPDYLPQLLMVPSGTCGQTHWKHQPSYPTTLAATFCTHHSASLFAEALSVELVTLSGLQTSCFLLTISVVLPREVQCGWRQ